jgi:hypothetical protein
MFHELNVPITEQCLLKAIRQLQTNRSSGPDKYEYLNEFFINGKHVLMPFLFYL